MMDTTNQQQYIAFGRLLQQLGTAGIDEENQAFILGRLVNAVIDRASAEVIRVLGAEELTRIDQLESFEAQQAEVERLFAEKKGTSLIEYRESIAEELVKEFEAQA